MDPQLARVIARMPVLDLSDIDKLRTLNEATQLPVSSSDHEVTHHDLRVPGPPGAPEVVVRVYRPIEAADEPLAAVVYFHPGLFFGTLNMDHARCMRFAAGARCLVLSVDYRLAPEHPYPAGVEDCYAALSWAATVGPTIGVDPTRLAVAGCSTGATLAAAVALLARDRGGPKIAFQMLLQPALDDRLDTLSMAEFAEPGQMESGRAGGVHKWRYYLGENPSEVSPYAAPARATDLTGLPPTYVSTNEYDCLRDEGTEYALRLIRAGVPTELHHYAGTFHAFDLVVRTAAISQRAVEEQVAVLRHALDAKLSRAPRRQRAPLADAADAPLPTRPWQAPPASRGDAAPTAPPVARQPVRAEALPTPEELLTMAKPGLLESVSRMQELADVMVPTTIRAVSDLGVADLLADGPRPLVELATATGAHAPSLRRALRALTAKEIFAEVEPDVFALTPLADLLRRDHPMSLRSQCRLFPAGIEAWAHVDHTLRTGEPAFNHVHGTSLWEYLAQHDADSARFDDFMSGLTTFEVRAALGAYDWSSVRTVVDVGGGNGAFLAGILRRYAHLRGTVYDLPHVVAGAPPVLARAGVTDRCAAAGGSFFETAPPAGADAYVVKRILYSWGDDDVLTILRNLRAAMGPQSRLLVIEPVGGESDGSRYAKLLDLLMLGIGWGRVREPAELDALFGKVGLRLTRVLPTFLFPIVEAVPQPE